MDSGGLENTFYWNNHCHRFTRAWEKLFLWQHPCEKNTKDKYFENSLINLLDRGHLETNAAEEIIVLASVEPKKQLFLFFYGIFCYPSGISQFTMKEMSSKIIKMLITHALCSTNAFWAIGWYSYIGTPLGYLFPYNHSEPTHQE